MKYFLVNRRRLEFPPEDTNLEEVEEECPPTPRREELAEAWAKLMNKVPDVKRSGMIRKVGT